MAKLSVSERLTVALMVMEMDELTKHHYEITVAYCELHGKHPSRLDRTDLWVIAKEEEGRLRKKAAARLPF